MDWGNHENSKRDRNEEPAGRIPANEHGGADYCRESASSGGRALSKEEYERLTRLEDAYWGEKAKAAEAEGYLADAETRDFVEASLRVEA